jgi:peptidoglycan/LPS O-acetylase OafA/YrhL
LLHRREIDGLRAVAVLPVMFFHAGFNWVSGGFLGVDVFFVISGYLITSIIAQELEQDRFSLLSFYERRIRRIVPALVFVCLCCIPPAVYVLFSDELRDFAGSLVAAAFFYSNIYFWQTSGYFRPETEFLPLVHTWSLAVEEQFYLFFPLLLIALRRARRRTLLVILAMLVCASLAGAQILSTFAPEANYYLMPSRLWELAVGAIVAFVPRQKFDASPLINQIASGAGLALVLGSMFLLDRTYGMPNLWSLFPVAGTALIIVFARRETLAGAILGSPVLVWIGLISYSAYLWHQPVFVFGRLAMTSDIPGPALRLTFIAVALALGAITWRFVEQPFRKRVPGSARRVLVAACVSFAAVAIAGLGLQRAASAAFFSSPKEQAILNADAELPGPTLPCVPLTDSWSKRGRPCIYGPEPPLVIVAGDSHANGLASAMASNQRFSNLPLADVSSTGCAPAVGYERSDPTYTCSKNNRRVYDYILGQPSAEIVVLYSRWTFYFEGQRFNNLEGGIEYGVEVYALPEHESPGFVSSPDRVPAVGRVVRGAIQSLLDAGKKVVLVYAAPEPGWDVPAILAREHRFGIERKEPLSTSLDVYLSRSRNAREQLDLLPDHPNLVRIHPDQIFCNTFIAGRCVVQWEGKPLYRDANHLNAHGRRMLTDLIAKRLEAKGWLK